MSEQKNANFISRDFFGKTNTFWTNKGYTSLKVRQRMRLSSVDCPVILNCLLIISRFSTF